MISDSIQSSDPGGVLPINPNQILTPHELASVNQRSDLAGLLRLLAHFTLMGASGYLWATVSVWFAVPTLVIYGISLAFMFCPTHECIHRTAFNRQWLNDGVAWVAGLLSFYNSTFYRRYHKWHHRYTRVAGKDPELTDPEPKSWRQYLWQLSGIPWWWGKMVGHFKVASGQFEDYFFLPESAYAEVMRSTWLQLSTYGVIILLSTALGHPLWLLKYWLLPLAIGQPFLRFILMAEHTGCSADDNPLTNTRTTITLWPLRFLMWNMPYHAEHHLYPSIPFHALPQAHQQLKPHFTHVEPGYLWVNQKIVATFG